MKQVEQIWIARFADGTLIAKTGKEFSNELKFYNWICLNRLGKKYGKLIEITAKVF